MNIKCLAVGDPAPTVTWTKVTNDICSRTQPYTTLSMSSLQPSDLGTWECTAQSQYGTVTKQITLTANGKINRGSYMSAHVLLNLLNELGKRDKMRGLLSILALFRNKLNKFNNTRARMLDSIYHMTNTFKSHFWRKNVIILSL